MATVKEILQSMVNSAPAQAADVSSSISSIDTIIAQFQEKQDAMKEGIGDVATLNLEEYLKTLYPVLTHHQFKGSTYNMIELPNGTLTDWKIYQLIDLAGIEFKTNKQFICEGDKTNLFKKDIDIGFTLQNSKEYSIIENDSEYTPGNDFPFSNFTTVDIKDEVLDDTLTQIWIFELTYSPGNTTIDDLVNEWNFAHNYITTPIGTTTGTYGTQDNIAKLTNAKNMLNKNKTKLENTSVMFGPYI